MLTPKIANDNGLGRTSGAWITSTDGSPAVVPDSPAAEAGLQENDIIFEINAIPVMRESTLLSIIQKYRPGDRIGMKVQRGEKIIIQEVVLGEFSGN
jgi:putative serine protease PepD